MRKLLVLFLCCCLTGCSATAVSRSEQTVSEEESQVEEGNSEFESYLNDLFVESVTENSITLHYTLKNPEKLGIEHVDATYGDLDFSEDDIEEDRAEIEEELENLHQFKDADLSEEEQLTYDILDEYLTLQDQMVDYEYYSSAFNVTSGVQNNLPVTLAEYRLDNEQDVIDVISLLNQIPEYFDACVKLEEIRIEKGLGLADFTLEEDIEQCKSFIEDPENNFLEKALCEKVAEMGLSEDYQTQIHDAVANSVIPAYEKLITSLQSFIGKGKNQLGLYYLPDGEEYYKLLVASNTGSRFDVDTLMEMSENALYNAIVALSTVYRKNQSAYNYFYSNDISVGMDAEEIVEYLKEHLTEHYPAIEEVNYEIKEVDPSLQDSLSPAFYMIPTIDDTSENVIYINPAQTTEDTLFVTLAHEGYPGHLYQTVYFNQTQHSYVRSLLSLDGFVEGWAEYVEINSYDDFDYGKYSDEIAILERAIGIISISASAIIDLGVNGKGWTLEDCQDFLDYYGLNADAAKDIMEYVISEPANYQQYFVGYLEFTDIRSEAETTLGDDFDEVQFHKAIMDCGPAQFDIVYNYVKEHYIDMQ